METNRPVASKPSRSFDSAYSFSFSIALGLALFIAGLVISLTIGQGTSIGLIFGVPLLMAGLILPVIMMRDLFKTNEIRGECPYCGGGITTSDSTLRLQCPNCRQVVAVKQARLERVEQ